MAVPAPAIQWPEKLEEMGPEADPGIMLTGAARVADVPFEIVALRMREGMRLPDFLSGLPELEYDVALCEMIGEIEYLAGSIEPNRVEIRGAPYLLWMVPSTRS